ncbi:MAG: hypothetical protein KGI78_01645 [Patescibacteria group bacterium]|nr:hypothetical protein [Patescibacteria group bacterium]MDE1943959.1 hypothetical protein [Patescibacteria group bacterium]MDE1944938.1 hypothetical protein [Patescibacteria group bacterium]MDE2057538.1 hypothetical protein [Patescibacteria group bacterium]
MSGIDVASLGQVSTLATHSAITVWAAVSGFLVLIIPALLLVLFSRYVGKGQYVALLLAFYAAYALYAAFPYVALLPTAPAITALATRLGIYAALVFLFYIILRRVVVSDFLYIGLVGLLVLSLLGSAFLLALAYHVFPVSSVYHFNAALDPFFSPKQYFFWWFAGPAVGLFFFAK